jgi:phosphoglycolate phosphatase-like HAD superfamily hydrolase
MKPLVLLFDIDGTLITTGGAGKLAIQRAFQEVHGRNDATAHFSFGGMTDRAIVREGLKAIGQATSERDIDRVLDSYISHLGKTLVASPSHRAHVGIAEALQAAEAREICAIGLGTGNVIDGARAKLVPVGLFERFAFGGFGNDHEDRAELIRIGAERGAQKLGRLVADCRVVVIGDTPKDIDAAHRNGAFALAVTTGSFKREALHEADVIFDSLADAGAIEVLLGD